MKRSRLTESQIVSIVKEADAGRGVMELCRTHGISEATFYNWKSKYGGLSASELHRLRETEGELGKLKRMYADLALEHRALKDLLEKKLEGRRRNGKRWGTWKRLTGCRFSGVVGVGGCLGRLGIGRLRREWTKITP